MAERSESTEEFEKDIPPFRYTNKSANEIELKWQKYWQENGSFDAVNPEGPYGDKNGSHEKAKVETPFFIMDMFPYPSGAGLHVGHPLGFIATDVTARFHRLLGENVLYSMGFDAFGVPAELYAIQTGQHPRKTTNENIQNILKQLKRLGLSHDERRRFATIDDDYVKWTQYIFLQIYNSWYDENFPKNDGTIGSARPIEELIEKFRSGELLPKGYDKDSFNWDDLDSKTQSEILNEYRLAYISNTPVNWAPGLGTVVSNEEIRADGLTERGLFPVFQKPLKQWSMRITEYAQRLLDGLNDLDWPEKVKLMQINWIGKSTGAMVDFEVKVADDNQEKLTVFTTRPDTLFGATFMVVAPEHPILEQVPEVWDSNTKEIWKQAFADPKSAVKDYQLKASKKTAMDRALDSNEKTGIFTGLYGKNPLNDKLIPIFTADYVLMDYGTGAIMAVPGGDQRDFDFAKKFDLDIIYTVKPKEGEIDESKAFTEEGEIINSQNQNLNLNGSTVEEAKKSTIKYLEEIGVGKEQVNYRLRDWIFSRQRYWGEPFPIVYDIETNEPIALKPEQLPILLPDVADYQPITYDPNDSESTPQAPLDRITDWIEVELDLDDEKGKRKFRRESNVMPNWAGSCWYYLRYADPHFSPLADNPKGVEPFQSNEIINPQDDEYWLGPNHNQYNGKSGGVDLYVGGVEHSVLHLLYARFWHMILHDLGFLSSPEPFHKLFSQGYIQGYAYTDDGGIYVPASEVEEKDGKFYYQGKEVHQEYGKIGKSLKNVVTPDEVIQEYGADTFRLYEMSMGPLDISRPWETRAVVGSFRFLQRLWRNIINEDNGDLIVEDVELNLDTTKLLHKTIYDVQHELQNLRPNTAIARLIELNNHFTKLEHKPRELAEKLVIMLSPFAPHIAEELWSKLQPNAGSIVDQSFPVYDSKYLESDKVKCIVQINGKLKGTLEVSPEITETELEQFALESDLVKKALGESQPKKVIVKAPKVVSIVV